MKLIESLKGWQWLILFSAGFLIDYFFFYSSDQALYIYLNKILPVILLILWFAVSNIRMAQMLNRDEQGQKFAPNLSPLFIFILILFGFIFLIKARFSFYFRQESVDSFPMVLAAITGLCGLVIILFTARLLVRVEKFQNIKGNGFLLTALEMLILPLSALWLTGRIDRTIPPLKRDRGI